MAIKDTIKEGPLKLAGITISGVAAILTSVWAIDNHYASAADISQFRSDVQSQIVEIRRDTTVQTYQLRRESLRDKIEDLNLKEDSQALTPYEVRQRDRYIGEVNKIDNLLTDVERSNLGIEKGQAAGNSRSQAK